MTVAVKDLAQAIRDNKTTYYASMMDTVGFTGESLMATLSHLVDHKAQSTSFVGMNPPHHIL
jgi:hypothetical protein